MRFGQVHLENESWGPAAKAFRLAIDQGDLTNPGTTRLLLGISLFNLGEREAAVRAFERAGTYDKVSDQAEQWIKHVERAELLESVSGD